MQIDLIGGKPEPIRKFFKYFGSKWRISSKYKPPLPGLPVVEPFAGSAGYSLKWGVEKAILIDLDERTAAVWNYLINVKESEILALPVWADRETCIDDFAIPQEAKWLISSWMAMAGKWTYKRFSPSAIRHLMSKDRPMTYWDEGIRHRIANNLHRIRKWEAHHGGYESAPDIRATWFFDPPYIDTNRSLGSEYRETHKGLNHDDLIAFIQSRKGGTIVTESGEADWLPFERLNYRQNGSNHQNGKKIKSVESVYYGGEYAS